MADFKIALKDTLGIEGGISNHPDDRGGFTYKGISRKTWPNWGGWKIVDYYKDLSKIPPTDIGTLDAMVREFYRENFWDRIGLTSINNQKIANELFDTAVNAGAKQPILFLQRALNLLNRNGALYPDTKIDGIIGNKTLELTNSHPYPDALLKLLNGLQLSYYVAICEKDPSQEEFLRGWLRRVL
jgi:lysozyme family protein